jgi:septal ring factor EnvC (AmiA/AmiB activator)
MNNLLFTALIIALLYYCFYYLPPNKKNHSHPKLTHSQATQTETEPSSNNPLNGPGPISFPSNQTILDPEQIKKLSEDIRQKESTIIGLNNSYQKLETKKNSELDNLKKQISTITSQLTQLQTNQNNDEKDSKKTLDNLLKDIQKLSEELN